MRIDRFLERHTEDEKKTMVVCAADDHEVMTCIGEVLKRELCNCVLVGNKESISKIAQELNINISDCEIIHTIDKEACARESVSLVNAEKANVLMKGGILTKTIMHAILDKNKGIRGEGIMNSVCAIDCPKLNRIVYLSDPGVVAFPTFQQKVDIINNTVSFVRKLGVDLPKVAVVCAVEIINPNMPSTLEAAALALMGQRGQLENCIVDGPLGLDNALFPEAVKHKKVNSPVDVCGKADIVIMPNAECGNGIMKAVRFMTDSATAGVLLGAKVPVVMTSRADSAENKLRSVGLALAASE
jgi:phosphate butyryltransferase